MSDIDLLKIVHNKLTQGDNCYFSLEPKQQDYLDNSEVIFSLEGVIETLILSAFKNPDEAYQILRVWPYDIDGYCELGGKDYWFKDIDEACHILISERGWT